ncbi:unnamed protein product [Fusarium fujikuroi]|nr:unnamed protein product [Fusarium fujikuroi]
MDPSNADILDYVTSMPALQTVLRDAHEILKAAITAYVLQNYQKQTRAFVTEAESTNRARYLRSRPDFIYGWIPPRHVIDDDEIPAWSKQEAEAVDGTNLLYPFLVVKVAPDSDDFENLCDAIGEPAFNCLQGASIDIRMVDRLYRRLEACGWTDPGLNSSMYGLVVNRNTASLYFSYAWDETSEHFHRVARYNMKNKNDQRDCEKMISNILSWGAITRLRGIQIAIEVIRSNKASWYPRYQQENCDFSEYRLSCSYWISRPLHWSS